MKALFNLLCTSILLAACGGDSRIEQYRVGSYPGVFLGFVAVPFQFVPNLNARDDLTLREQPCLNISGFEPTWGTRYDITVRVTKNRDNGLTDNRCSEDSIELLSIDSIVLDPIGTRYYNDERVIYTPGSGRNGLYISRNPENPDEFNLRGYAQRFYCALEVCGPLLGSATGEFLTAGYAFELMEIEGERVIGLIKL